MPRRYRRTDRVEELLKEEIAGVLREVGDPRVGFVTVMDIEVSPDLRHARVYVSVLGDEEEKTGAIEALQRASGFVRVRIGEVVTLKYLPQLHFVLDRTLEKAARIDQLIDEMRADVGAGEGEGDPAADGEPGGGSEPEADGEPGRGSEPEAPGDPDAR